MGRESCHSTCDFFPRSPRLFSIVGSIELSPRTSLFHLMGQIYFCIFPKIEIKRNFAFYFFGFFFFFSFSIMTAALRTQNIKTDLDLRQILNNRIFIVFFFLFLCRCSIVKCKMNSEIYAQLVNDND